MRITGGRLRGRRVASPGGSGIRPTSDRVREALFNMVGHDLSGFRVADLFAGSGILGLEALSRGAESAVFIDRSRKAVQLVRRNLALCGLEDRANVLQWDLRRGMPGTPGPSEGPFDLVFLDPPYLKGLLPQALAGLLEGEALAPGCLVVAETSRVETPASGGDLIVIDTRVYGDTRITYYAHKD